LSAIFVDGSTLTIEDVGAVARLGAVPRLAPRARRAMARSRALVDRTLRAGTTAYGVNTGFGHLSDVHIAPERLADLQLNLVRSHACGVGAPFAADETRAMMLLRANTLAKGVSGIRPAVVETLLAMLRANIVPVVPSQGSVGASGDLAPLAHLALALIGEGAVVHRGRARRADQALRAARIAPVCLGPKEGLSLINGTQAMTAVGALVLLDAEELVRHADLAGAMSLEALKGSATPFDRRIHEVRPHPGQTRSAANLRRLLRASEIMDSHRDCGRVQDSYALRCMPQVHGAARGALAHVREVLAIEVNAGTDNPLVFTGPRAGLVSGGNFHGQPVAAALDFLAIAMTSLASICERRVDRLVNPYFSGLPAFLSEESGLNSGFMLAQVTAAALVSESKVLSHPASVDSIPTSANKEDHVSMGPIAARKAAAVVANARRVLAIELLAASQALDFLSPLRPAKAVAAAHRALRRRVAHLSRDRVMAGDIEAVAGLIRSGELVRAAERAGAGPIA
jgi:histidine ammonia-lyase